jgi:arylsulfatase A-like enzyme
LQACRSGNWKLKLDNGKTELFDLSKDPSEAHDLSATNADVVTRLRGEMDAFQKKIARR